jgi:hypothetical protein
LNTRQLLFEVASRFLTSTSDFSIIWHVLEESQRAALRKKACDITNAKSPSFGQWTRRYKSNLQNLLKVSKNPKNSAYTMTTFHLTCQNLNDPSDTSSLVKIAVLKARAKRLHLQMRPGNRNRWFNGGGCTRPQVHRR